MYKSRRVTGWSGFFFLGCFQGDPDWRIRLPVPDFWLILTQSLDVYKGELIIRYSEAGITATAGLNSCYIESIVRKGDDIYYLTVTCLIVNVWFMPDALSDATKKENQCVATWIFLWKAITTSPSMTGSTLRTPRKVACMVLMLD